MKFQKAETANYNIGAWIAVGDVPAKIVMRYNYVCSSDPIHHSFSSCRQLTHPLLHVQLFKELKQPIKNAPAKKNYLTITKNKYIFVFPDETLPIIPL